MAKKNDRRKIDYRPKIFHPNSTCIEYVGGEADFIAANISSPTTVHRGKTNICGRVGPAFGDGSHIARSAARSRIELDMVNVDDLAGWRREFQDLYELMDISRERFAAWSEEVARIEGENHP